MRFSLFYLALPVALFAESGHAETADKNLAQSLFEQGKQLMQKNDLNSACPKFEESFRLDPAGGTAMNVALCHEKQHKIATAWTDFKTALSLARRDGRPDRATVAEEHIAALETALPYLTIKVSAAAEGEQLTLDGADFREAGWGTPLAIDPGEHVIVARAPGKKSWTQKVQLTEKEQKAVEVPILAEDPSANPAEKTGKTGGVVPPITETTSDGSGGKTAGWIVGGAGVAAIGVGAFFGVRALSKRSQSDDHCGTDTTCDSKGVELNDQAKTSAWIANIGVGVGIVGVAVGTYLLLTGESAPADHGTSTRHGVKVNASVGPSGGGFVLGGSF